MPLLLIALAVLWVILAIGVSLIRVIREDKEFKRSQNELSSNG